MPLERRTPLKRSTKPIKRTEMRKVSKGRRSEGPERERVVEKALATYGFCLARHLGGCNGKVVGHELVKRSATRKAHLNQSLVVTVCWFHNGWVEDNPHEAQRQGLSIPGWAWRKDGEATLEEAARLRIEGTRDPYWMEPPE